MKFTQKCLVILFILNSTRIQWAVLDPKYTNRRNAQMDTISLLCTYFINFMQRIHTNC